MAEEKPYDFKFKIVTTIDLKSKSFDVTFDSLDQIGASVFFEKIEKNKLISLSLWQINDQNVILKCLAQTYARNADIALLENNKIDSDLGIFYKYKKIPLIIIEEQLSEEELQKLELSKEDHSKHKLSKKEILDVIYQKLMELKRIY